MKNYLNHHNHTQDKNGWNSSDSFKSEINQAKPLPLHITALVVEYYFNER